MVTAAPPTLASCGVCDSLECLYIVGSGFLCVGCVTLAVELAANSLFSDCVSYTRAFERVLFDG